MDDHLPHRKMEEVELADTMIRICDYCGLYEIELSGYIDCKKSKGINVYKNKLARLYFIHQEVTPKTLHIAVYLIIKYCEDFNLDLEGAILEKLEYNKNRQDHKIENRKAKGGKLF